MLSLFPDFENRLVLTLSSSCSRQLSSPAVYHFPHWHTSACLKYVKLQISPFKFLSRVNIKTFPFPANTRKWKQTPVADVHVITSPSSYACIYHSSKCGDHVGWSQKTYACKGRKSLGILKKSSCQIIHFTRSSHPGWVSSFGWHPPA